MTFWSACAVANKNSLQKVAFDLTLIRSISERMRTSLGSLSCRLSIAALCGSCQAYESGLLELAMNAGMRTAEDAGNVRVVERIEPMTPSMGGTQEQRPTQGFGADAGDEMTYTDDDAGHSDAGTNTAESMRGRSQYDAGADAGLVSAKDGAADSSVGNADSSVPPLGAAPCPETAGKTWNDNGHCYFPLNVAYSWYVSRDTCRESGAELVTITSEQEQAFVATLVTAEPRWTGLARFGTPAFKWITGEAAVFENWEMGAPSSLTEHAALLRPGTGRWFDDGVTATHLVLCERAVN